MSANDLEETIMSQSMTLIPAQQLQTQGVSFNSSTNDPPPKDHPLDGISTIGPAPVDKVNRDRAQHDASVTKIPTDIVMSLKAFDNAAAHETVRVAANPHSAGTSTSTLEQSTGRTITDLVSATTMGSSINITVKAVEPVTTSIRGRGKANRGKGKGRTSTKRKRKHGDGEDEEESGDSEVCAPTAVMTKSGRSVQRPTTFVPPAAPSPVAAPAVKKKRVWRKNPENAVCKLCLRGVSPASNMIVFCDGCNTPYHRWCHHPPIDQSVIEETDKEWYCRQCRRERIVPVPEADVAHFTVARGASVQERQKFFSALTPGALVTLLTRMSTQYPDLPVFDPSFASKHALSKAATSSGVAAIRQASTGDSQQPVINASYQPATIYAHHDDEDEDEGYGPEEHPAHYVRPGQGLMSTLPPERDNEEHLVDEDSSKGVFHHIYLVDERAANSRVVGEATHL